MGLLFRGAAAIFKAGGCSFSRYDYFLVSLLLLFNVLGAFKFVVKSNVSRELMLFEIASSQKSCLQACTSRAKCTNLRGYVASFKLVSKVTCISECFSYDETMPTYPNN